MLAPQRPADYAILGRLALRVTGIVPSVTVLSS